jgi:hypothetical protein
MELRLVNRQYYTPLDIRKASFSCTEVLGSNRLSEVEKCQDAWVLSKFTSP